MSQRFEADASKAEKRRAKGVASRLLLWYAQHGRRFPWRRRDEPVFRRVVVEVLLQRTTAEAVARMYDAFFARYPTWEALGRAKDMEGRLKPLGLWRRRTTSLRALADAMCVREGQLPSERDELESIPAVGQYVASAALLFAHASPEPLLDSNMVRVIERYFGPRDKADYRYDARLQALARAMVRSGDPVLINWAILDLGAMICGPRVPRCVECPLRRGCATAAMERASLGRRQGSLNTRRSRTTRRRTSTLPRGALQQK